MKYIFNIKRRLMKMIGIRSKKEKSVNIVSNIKPEWEELCNQCSSIAKAVGWTKKDSRELLKKVRSEASSIR